MAERTGQIIEYNPSNKQGFIKPDDGGPQVRFYLRNLGEAGSEPKPGFKVSFDAPPLRKNKKREEVQDPASSVSITDSSTVFQPRRDDSGGRFSDRRSGRGGRERGGRERGGFRDRGSRSPRREGRGSPERGPRGAGSGRDTGAPVLTQKLFTPPAGQTEGSPPRDTRPPPRFPRRGADRPRRPRTLRPRGRDAGLQVEIKGKEQSPLRRPPGTRDRVGDGEKRPSGRYLPAVTRDVRALMRQLTTGAISPSLLFDKYPRCSLSRRNAQGRTHERSFSEKSKREFLESSFLNAYRYCWGNRNAWHAIYRRAFSLFKSMETAGYKVLSLAFKNSSRFMIGHCGPGVLEECGIAMQHTYGYPVIPASVIKGVLRTQAGMESSSVKIGRQELAEIFGEPGRAGQVVFFDALPIDPPALEVDLTNSHFPRWYSQQEPPADDQTPHPAFFVLIKPGSQFVFSMALERGAEPALLDKAGALLKAALLEQGLGAKTAVGYGIWER
jgi:CRISPR-associated protein Cmr6